MKIIILLSLFILNIFNINLSFSLAIQKKIAKKEWDSKSLESYQEKYLTEDTNSSFSRLAGMLKERFTSFVPQTRIKILIDYIFEGVRGFAYKPIGPYSYMKASLSTGQGGCGFNASDYSYKNKSYKTIQKSLENKKEIVILYPGSGMDYSNPLDVLISDEKENVSNKEQKIKLVFLDPLLKEIDKDALSKYMPDNIIKTIENLKINSELNYCTRLNFVFKGRKIELYMIAKEAGDFIQNRQEDKKFISYLRDKGIYNADIIFLQNSSFLYARNALFTPKFQNFIAFPGTVLYKGIHYAKIYKDRDGNDFIPFFNDILNEKGFLIDYNSRGAFYPRGLKLEDSFTVNKAYFTIKKDKNKIQQLEDLDSYEKLQDKIITSIIRNRERREKDFLDLINKNKFSKELKNFFIMYSNIVKKRYDIVMKSNIPYEFDKNLYYENLKTFYEKNKKNISKYTAIIEKIEQELKVNSSGLFTEQDCNNKNADTILKVLKTHGILNEKNKKNEINNHNLNYFIKQRKLFDKDILSFIFFNFKNLNIYIDSIKRDGLSNIFLYENIDLTKIKEIENSLKLNARRLKEDLLKIKNLLWEENSANENNINIAKNFKENFIKIKHKSYKEKPFIELLNAGEKKDIQDVCNRFELFANYLSKQA